MKVLGIDTSAIVCSVALVSQEKTLASRTVSDGLTHSETLLPLIKEVLDQCGISVADLDGIAITHGPGSFTGLRIGISSVKGLAVSKNIPCIGISTLEALAMNGIEYEGTVVCPVMDARRGEFYNALFRVNEHKLVRICEDRAIPGEAIAQELSAYDRVLIVGDGAMKFVQMHPDFSDALAPEEIRYQSGESVAVLGRGALSVGKYISSAELAPSYLRLPQAEREWKEKNKQ